MISNHQSQTKLLKGSERQGILGARICREWCCCDVSLFPQNSSTTPWIIRCHFSSPYAVQRDLKYNKQSRQRQLPFIGITAPGTLRSRDYFERQRNNVYCELHKCFACFCSRILQVVTHSDLGYSGSPNTCRLLLLLYVALGDRTGGRPTVSGAQQNGCPRQLADPTAQGSQGPPGQPAGLQQTQALSQEQQVTLPETDPHPHLQSPALQQPRKKAGKKTR